MNFQPRFHTETKEYPQKSIYSSAKPVANIMHEYDFSTQDTQTFPKCLTVFIHEAKLFEDVSLLGKMTTFTKYSLDL